MSTTTTNNNKLLDALVHDVLRGADAEMVRTTLETEADFQTLIDRVVATKLALSDAGSSTTAIQASSVNPLLRRLPGDAKRAFQEADVLFIAKPSLRPSTSSTTATAPQQAVCILELKWLRLSFFMGCWNYGEGSTRVGGMQRTMAQIARLHAAGDIEALLTDLEFQAPEPVVLRARERLGGGTSLFPRNTMSLLDFAIEVQEDQGARYLEAAKKKYADSEIDVRVVFGIAGIAVVEVPPLPELITMRRKRDRVSARLSAMVRKSTAAVAARPKLWLRRFALAAVTVAMCLCGWSVPLFVLFVFVLFVVGATETMV